MVSSTSMTALRRLVAAPAVLLLLLVAAVVAAPAQARDLRASVKGFVLDSLTGKGVGGTEVYVMEQICPWGCGAGAATDWEPLASATTSRTGAYTVALPRAGTFRVFFVPADRDSYAMEAYPDAALPLTGDDVVVRYGKATTNISVKLDPSKRIEGHVWAAESRWTDGEDDGDYAGLADIPVYVAFQGGARINMFIENPNTVPEAALIGVDTTSDTGFYSVPGFKAFPFFIWANADPYGWSGTHPNFAYLPDADPTRRDRIVDDGSDAFPDGVKEMNTFLGTTTEMNIRGRLVDESGTPLAGLPIVVWESDQSEQEQSFQPTCTVTTDANGVFGDLATMTDPDEIACLNLVEPFVVLEFRGTDALAAEFFDDAYDEWGAQWVPVTWGWPTDIGDWVVGPTGGGGS